MINLLKENPNKKNCGLNDFKVMQIFYMNKSNWIANEFLMQLHITEDTLIKNIQNEFNIFYPFLKIDFLKDNTANKKYLQKTEKINPDEQIKIIGKINRACEINVSRQTTVAGVKKDFKEILGLTVEVYRKSGNVWIETSLTDDWTLEQQNKEGEQISLHSNTSLSDKV